jgi:hypothetical protein
MICPLDTDGLFWAVASAIPKARQPMITIEQSNPRIVVMSSNMSFRYPEFLKTYAGQYPLSNTFHPRVFQFTNNEGRWINYGLKNHTAWINDAITCCL